MNWNRALKVGGPSVVITYVFYMIMDNYKKESELIQSSLLLNVLFLVIVFLFCIFVCYRVTAPKNNSSNKPQVVNNEIVGNEVGASLNIGQKFKDADVNQNKVKNNKVKDDLNIG